MRPHIDLTGIPLQLGLPDDGNARPEALAWPVTTWTLQLGITAATDAERADAWLRTIDEALVPIAHRIATETPLSILNAAELAAAWYQGVSLSPADELVVLAAAGSDDTARAHVLRCQVAADELVAALGTSLARPAAAVALLQRRLAAVPLSRRERRAQRRAARRGA